MPRDKDIPKANSLRPESFYLSMSKLLLKSSIPLVSMPASLTFFGTPIKTTEHPDYQVNKNLTYRSWVPQRAPITVRAYVLIVFEDLGYLLYGFKVKDDADGLFASDILEVR
jgi:hypothetical protein